VTTQVTYCANTERTETCYTTHVLSGCRAAQQHATDMATRNYYNDTDPDGVSTSGRFSEICLAVSSGRPMYWGESRPFSIQLLAPAVHLIYASDDAQSARVGCSHCQSMANS
jgi:hypothetical protein